MKWVWLTVAFGCSLLPTQVKIQKHQSFEAEIAAHNHSILSLKAKGLEMIQKDHFAAEAIKVQQLFLSSLNVLEQRQFRLCLTLFSVI